MFPEYFSAAYRHKCNRLLLIDNFQSSEHTPCEQSNGHSYGCKLYLCGTSYFHAWLFRQTYFNDVLDWRMRSLHFHYGTGHILVNGNTLAIDDNTICDGV